MNILRYGTPARKWEDALPIGNGRLGGMIYGTVKSERIQVNEISLWSGEPYPCADRADAYKYLPELRALIDANKYSDAQKLADDRFTNDGGGFDGAYSGSYQTLGEIKITHNRMPDIPADYLRTLDIENAVAEVSYKLGGVSYKREIFSSAPAGVIYIRLSASEPASISVTASFERKFLSNKRVKDNAIVFGGNADGNVTHMRFDGMLKAVSTGGNITDDGKNITVSQADSVIFVFAARTDYILSQKDNFKGEAPEKAVYEDVEKALLLSFNQQKELHIKDYRKYYDRCCVNFGSDGKENTDTDKRIRQFSKHGRDKSLCELFFQYGRYLLISSSRPDNILPANLQGLWCKDYKAPWHCDYHTNINIQMNYWPAGPANLIDCTRSLANLICAEPENGRKTAKAYYNAEGWTLYTITNPWLWTSPGWGGGWSQYPLGGAWMCRHLWEYYTFTNDLSLLKEFYPVMRENCLFNISLLVENERGELYTNPATSPENNFKDDSGNVGWLGRATAMDIEVLYDNFTYMAQACRILNTDKELEEKITALRDRLKKLCIGSQGQLCEWEGDWDMNAPEINHRHCSHLYGLHPGTMISCEKTPELAAAAKRSLEIRGDDGTGWSLAWKINFYERLCDGNRAYKLLSRLLRPVGLVKYNYTNGGGVYKNLFDAHPPFQIDGNFGALSGICEMLLQSQDMTDDGGYILKVLPALPDEFSNGEAKGLLARGNTEADIRWENGRLSELVLRPSHDGSIYVKGTFGVFSAEGETACDSFNGITGFIGKSGIEYRLVPSN